MPKKPIDVVLFVEHVARELDIDCAVKYLAAQRHAMTVEIASIINHVGRTLARYEPEIVALPFCRSSSTDISRRTIQEWPTAVYVNLAYEQVFRKHQEAFRAPGDTLSGGTCCTTRGATSTRIS